VALSLVTGFETSNNSRVVAVASVIVVTKRQPERLLWSGGISLLATGA
jgi:hypothetical protein